MPLVDRVFDALPQGSMVTQVYQKWAALNFDVTPEPDREFGAFLDEIEILSKQVCERCGAPAIECIDKGWVVALCLQHARAAACVQMDGQPVT